MSRIWIISWQCCAKGTHLRMKQASKYTILFCNMFVTMGDFSIQHISELFMWNFCVSQHFIHRIMTTTLKKWAGSSYPANMKKMSICDTALDIKNQPKKWA